jgi:ABC-type transport system involved in multi-copper enzyme maturation permease subunit
MELVRQPVFLLLMTCSAGFSVFLSCVPYFGFGDDPKLVKDSVLAIMLLSGLFGAVLSASASVAHEIRSGTALAVLAKPVGRARFLLAKYLGLVGSLAVLTYVNLLSALIASRMAFDAYGDVDTLAFWLFAGLVVVGYALGGFTNYFLRRPFVADAVFFVVMMVTAAFLLISFVDKEGHWQTFAKGVDWRLVPASILILFALCILAGLALACSTRWEMIPTLAVCSALFLLGLMSDYLFGRRAEAGSWWASILYTVIPNWQLFWLADALENQKSIPWSYVGQALGYVVGYLGASLALALLLFEDRELT